MQGGMRNDSSVSKSYTAGSKADRVGVSRDLRIRRLHTCMQLASHEETQGDLRDMIDGRLLPTGHLGAILEKVSC